MYKTLRSTNDIKLSAANSYLLLSGLMNYKEISV